MKHCRHKNLVILEYAPTGVVCVLKNGLRDLKPAKGHYPSKYRAQCIDCAREYFGEQDNAPQWVKRGVKIYLQEEESR